jgi:predicted RNase H-like HicB family nuclease
VNQRYTIVIERAPNNYSAYVPDVLGCITTGKTVEETKRNMRDALAGHLALMRESGEPLPPPRTRPEDVADLEPDDIVAIVDVEVPGPVAV